MRGVVGGPLAAPPTVSEARSARASAVRRAAPSPQPLRRGRNKAADTERQLLASAEGAFARKGYLRTTVHDIVDGTGLSRAAFYRYFRSTDDVFVRLVDRVVDDLVASSKVHSGATLRARVGDSNRRYLEIFARNRGVLRAMFEASYVNPQIAAIQARMRSAYLMRVRDHLARQQALGHCHPLDPDAAAMSLAMLVSGVATSWVLMGLEPFESPLDLDRLSAQVTDIWCRAVYTDPDRVPPGDTEHASTQEKNR